MKLWQPKIEPDADGFYETGITAVSLQSTPMQAVKINGRKVVLAQYEGKLVAFDSRCPHASADMSQGELHRWKLYCPEHSYCFDVRNGRIAWPEDEVYRLKMFATVVKNDMIRVKLS
ncbi:MAG: hypothetical protein DWQ04_33750 [Chloroflexi bacterium]|nr:MAG: hypothetical protein DWQ04_33750 [Chloroflexota bacterium]